MSLDMDPNTMRFNTEKSHFLVDGFNSSEDISQLG